MRHPILLVSLLLTACITVGDGGLDISAHVQKKDGGTFERCKLSVFYDDRLYEERQIAPSFSVYLVVPPTGQSARIDITCDGSKTTFSAMSGSKEEVRLGDIYL